MKCSALRQAIIPTVITIAFLVSGCAPDSDGDAAEVPVQKFVSAMTVTSDCGVENRPESDNGFAGPVGTEVTEMPDNIAERVAIGADREPVETDWERVAPGFLLPLG